MTAQFKKRILNSAQKSQWLFLLFISIGATVLTNCTDRRPFEMPDPRQLESNIPETATAVADVFAPGERVLQALQLSVSGRSLYLTGKPFAFARWDVSADPEDPSVTFSAADDLNAFSDVDKNGPWVVDYYGSGALAISGSTAIMSGTRGTSVVDISSTTQPREIQRYPKFDDDDGFVRDEAFVYKAILPHPTQSLLYGFREQDFIYTLGASSGSLQLQVKDAYDSQNVCCAEGAANFNGKVFVAMRAALWVFGLNGSKLTSPLVIDALQAVNVVSTGSYIYVQHEPALASVVAQYPRGIYMFDRNGRFVAHLPVSPIKFAVYNNTHIYANMDDQSVRIYRIRWDNIGAPGGF